jgi:manganese/zinc/iron transport system permease protein
MMNRLRSTACLLAAACLPVAHAGAARIGDMTELSWPEQALRFLSLSDTAVRLTLAGCLLLGLACGLLGSLLLVRRLSLTGDAISHSVLPGVVLGFWIHSTRDPFLLTIGAAATAALAMGTIRLLQSTTRLKEDTILGLVLAGFYAAGIFLLSIVQRTASGGQAGLESFLLGQASALSGGDVAVAGVIAGVSLLFVTLCFKELVTVSFDRGFAVASGLPVVWLDRILLGLLTLAIIAAVQAVGVVLVSALLVTPAATAFMLTRRMPLLCVLSVLIGMTSAAAGSFVSYLDSGLPTGPFIVLVAASFFLLALLFAPRRGLLPRWIRHLGDKRRIRTENALKSVFRRLEGAPSPDAGVPILEGAGQIHAKLAFSLQRAGLATVSPDGSRLMLTPGGWQRAAAVVRNHRLWELYLTHAADVPADHVHDDAEDVEHFLDEETVRRLERRLEFARSDPHGKTIPQAEDLNRGATAPPFRSQPASEPGISP